MAGRDHLSPVWEPQWYIPHAHDGMMPVNKKSLVALGKHHGVFKLKGLNKPSIPGLNKLFL